MPQRGIDRDKLRAAIRKLGDEYVFYLLDDAIDLLPQSKLVKLVGQYLDMAKLSSAPMVRPRPPCLRRSRRSKERVSRASTMRAST